MVVDSLLEEVVELAGDVAFVAASNLSIGLAFGVVGKVGAGEALRFTPHLHHSAGHRQANKVVLCGELG